MIGFGSDGYNVMMGSVNLVASRLKNTFPSIFILQCVFHTIHLCASESCKQLPRNCEDFARNIFNFLKSSLKHLAEFSQLQKFMEVEFHRMLHTTNTVTIFKHGCE